MPIKTIFLDRDGVINHERNYLFKTDDFEFIDGVFDVCKYFTKLKYEIVVVTNQSGISRGYYSEEDYEILTLWMLNQFKSKHVNILDVFHCPHSPKDNCKCRKPMPGMFLKAQKKYTIDMKSSWLIGDKEDDISAANASGIDKTILVRSGHQINESKSNARYFLNSIKEADKIITY